MFGHAGQPKPRREIGIVVAGVVPSGLHESALKGAIVPRALLCERINPLTGLTEGEPVRLEIRALSPEECVIGINKMLDEGRIKFGFQVVVPGEAAKAPPKLV